MPVTLVVLTALFFVQRFGTAGIGKFFGPITVLWFAALAVLGAIHISDSLENIRTARPQTVYQLAKMSYLCPDNARRHYMTVLYPGGRYG